MYFECEYIYKSLIVFKYTINFETRMLINKLLKIINKTKNSIHIDTMNRKINITTINNVTTCIIFSELFINLTPHSLSDYSKNLRLTFSIKIIVTTVIKSGVFLWNFSLKITFVNQWVHVKRYDRIIVKINVKIIFENYVT